MIHVDLMLSVRHACMQSVAWVAALRDDKRSQSPTSLKKLWQKARMPAREQCLRARSAVSDTEYRRSKTQEKA